jgi:hypothetical protein
VPGLQAHAHFRFRFRRPADREDAVADTIAHGFAAFVRLRQRGKEPTSFPGAFAKFIILDVSKGRAVGGRLNNRDVLAEPNRRRDQFTVFRLGSQTQDDHCWWREAAADRRTTVADQAAFNVDFPAWLATLAATKRRIAEFLAHGYAVDATARLVGVTPGRVSQVRRELAANWKAFHAGAGPESARRPSVRADQALNLIAAEMSCPT